MWEALLGLPPALIRSQTALSIPCLLAQLCIAGITSLEEAKRQNLHRTSDGKSPAAAASLIAQMLSTPPAVPVCLCSLSPLETGTQKCFLVQKNSKQSPVFAKDLLSTYLCVCCTSVPLALSVFVCVESTFCNRQMGMKYFKNVS